MLQYKFYYQNLCISIFYMLHYSLHNHQYIIILWLFCIETFLKGMAYDITMIQQHNLPFSNILPTPIDIPNLCMLQYKLHNLLFNLLAFLQRFDFVSQRRGVLSSMIRLIDLKVIYSFNIIWIFNFLEINFRIYSNFQSH